MVLMNIFTKNTSSTPIKHFVSTKHICFAPKLSRFIFCITIYLLEDPNNSQVICWREERERDTQGRGTTWNLDSSKTLSAAENKTISGLFEIPPWDASRASNVEKQKLDEAGEIPREARECLDEASSCASV